MLQKTYATEKRMLLEKACYKKIYATEKRMLLEKHATKKRLLRKNFADIYRKKQIR